MTYATRQDMIDRFGMAEVDLHGEDKVTATLADAAVEIDSYVGARYDLPLQLSEEASALLTRLACDVARYLCWDDTASDRVRDAAKDARTMLRDLARGTIALPGSTDAPAGSTGARFVDGGGRQMTGDKLKYF